MKIYIITKGEYSDYHICAVTEDKGKAEILQRLYNSRWDKSRIEVFNTDISIPEKPYGSESYYEVGFRPNGDVCFCEKCEDGSWLLCQYRKESEYVDITMIVDAPNEEAAIKIAAERRAEYLAKKNGIA